MPAPGGNPRVVGARPWEGVMEMAGGAPGAPWAFGRIDARIRRHRGFVGGTARPLVPAGAGRTGSAW